MAAPIRSLRCEMVASMLRRLRHIGSADSSVAEHARLLIGPLEREDAERGNNLVATLCAYYSCGARVDKTADALFLHRNSVRYRLDRIRFLIGLDIDRPDTIAALITALACREKVAQENIDAS